MKKVNVLFVIWGLIVITLVVLLTVLGFILKNNNKEYEALEEKLKVSAEKYTSNNFEYPEEGKEIIIKSNTLKKEGLLEELKYKNDVCEGYVVVKTNKVVEYKSYIKCKNYQTKDYEKKLGN